MKVLTIFIFMISVSYADDYKSLQESIYKKSLLLKRNQLGRKEILLGKAKFDESQEGRSSLSFDAVGTYSQSDSVILVEGESYSVDAEEFSTSSIMGVNLNYGKNLWRGGERKKFKQYLRHRLLRHKEMGSLMKEDFFRAINKYAKSYILLEEKIKMREKMLRDIQEVYNRVSKLVKGRILPRHGKEYIELTLGEIRRENAVDKLELLHVKSFFKRYSSLNSLKSVLKKSPLFKKTYTSLKQDYKSCSRDVSRIKKITLRELASEKSFKESQTGASADLFFSSNLSDQDGWNSPSFKSNLGVRFTIPIGETKTTSKEVYLKKKQALLKIDQEEMKVNERKENEVLEIELLDLHYNALSADLSKIGRRLAKYKNLFYKGVLTHGQYIKILSSYYSNKMGLKGHWLDMLEISMNNEIECEA